MGADSLGELLCARHLLDFLQMCGWGWGGGGGPSTDSVMPVRHALNQFTGLPVLMIGCVSAVCERIMQDRGAAFAVRTRSGV